MPLSAAAGGQRGARLRDGAGSGGVGDRQDDREARALAASRNRSGVRACSTRAMRSTIDRPRPRPCASRAPSSSRVNSRKTVLSLSDGNADAGVEDLDLGAARRAGGRRPGCGRVRVYLMALETRFWIRRRNRLRSVCTVSDDGTMTSSSFFSAAIGWKSVPIWRSSPSSRKTVSAGFMAPASSREMSSTAPRMVSTDSSEDSMLAAASPVAPCRPSRSATSNRAARR